MISWTLPFTPVLDGLWTWTGSLFSVLHIVLACYFLPKLMLQRKEPQTTIAWIFAIIFLPILGSLVYLAFGDDRLARRAARQRERARRVVSALPNIVRNLEDPVAAVTQEQIVTLLERISPYPPVQGNRIDVITDMDANFREQIDAIERAEHHVHLEYYIFRQDKIGARFAEAMLDAAARGVQVRFLYDAVGGMGLSSSFLKPLQQGGVEVARHIPMNLFSRRWIFNFRNHRKILVVDGKRAFMGGANIGEEYLGRSEVGEWVDLQLRFEGPAVNHLQRTFINDWVFASGLPFKSEGFFHHHPKAGEVITQIVPAGPDMEHAVFHELFFTAITTATSKVRMTTPYFVPTEPLRSAIENAGRRGVDVAIMLPGISTKPFVRLASHSYFGEMLDAGVKLYEFTPGFMHAKSLTVDGRWALVGTPNLDNRSLRLNFEVGASLYDVAITQSLDRLFDDRIGACRRLDRAEWSRRPIAKKVVENFCRLFSPIL